MPEDRPNPIAAQKRPRRVTAIEVARKAGVSRAAVSRAFSETAYLDAGKRELILQTAAELGYRPNALAASLQGNRTGLVAVIAGDLARQYDSAFVGELVSQLNAAGKWPIILGGPDTLTEQSVRQVLSYPLDAMIVRGGSLNAAIFDDAAQLSIPVIFSGRVVEAPLVDSVCCRNEAGARLAVETLISKGRRKIGYIGGPSDWSSENERLAGVISALQDAGLALSAKANADYSLNGGRDAARALLSDTNVDALFCANDAMALGALSAAKAIGQHHVPNTLSIIGFDDVPLAGLPEFDLTTLRNPVKRTVAQILRLLDARLADPTRKSEVVMISPELIERGTH